MDQEAEQLVAGTVEQKQFRDDYQDGIDDDLLVEDTRYRPGKLTLVLAAGIVIAGAFGGGVLTQKHYGTTTVATGAAAGFARFGAAGAAGAEGFPGGAGGFPGAAAGAGGAATGTGSGTAPSSVPVVVGTIVKVSGDKITVKNFAGKQVTVTVPDGATVSTSTAVSKLTAGSTVSVSGSKAADGSVTASSVTAQKK